MSRVWGYEAALDTGTVTVHVRRLREKIEDDPSRATPSPDRLGRRLPAGAVMPLAMIETAIAVGALTLAVGLVAVVLLRLLPSLRLQLVGLAALSVCLPLASVLALRLGRVPHGRRREDPGGLGRVRGRGGRRRDTPRPVDLRVGRARPDGVGRARRGRPPRRALRSRARSRSSTSPRRSTRWRRASSGCSTRAASSSRGRATTSGHRSRTCRRCSRRWRTVSSPSRRPSRSFASRSRILSSLVDDLFELARIDAGALTLELRDAPLERVVGSCLRGVEADARRRGIGLAASVPDDVSAQCAPEKVERVLVNLLTNALRHTPSDGSVAVRVEQVDRGGARHRRGHGRGARRRGTRCACSTASGGPIRRARRAAPASVSRSRGGSSRPMEDGSGRRTDPAGAHASRSRSPPPEAASDTSRKAMRVCLLPADTPAICGSASDAR